MSATETGSADTDTDTDSTDEAMRLIFADPARARHMGLRLRAAARRRGDPAAESAAERVLGVAARERGSLRPAASHLRQAVAVAEAARQKVLAAEARMSLALVLALQGDNAGALRLGARAQHDLRGPAAARLQMQLALIAQRAGSFDEAEAGYAQALTVFRRGGDRLWEAKALNNRGIMHVYRGRGRAADADLRRAEALYVELGQDLAVADVRWNRGFAAGRAGDVIAALDHLAAAERDYAGHGLSRALILLDRCDVLVVAGLFAEARDTAARAVEELARKRLAADLAEARLVLAGAALACGDLETAARAAGLAGRAFERQGRPGWAVVAHYLTVRAGWLGGRRDRATLRAALAGAAELTAAGWAVPAADAALIAARIALGLGDVEVATEQLRAVGHARRNLSPALRVSAWHAVALLRLAVADLRGGETALRAALRSLDEHRLTLGATELRVRAAEHGVEVVSTALSLALRSGRAGKVLAWAERGRSRTAWPRPIGPPVDADLAAEIAELRAVASEREQALAQRTDSRHLARRQATLERSIREGSRRVTGGGPDRVAAPTRAAIVDGLGGRALVDLVVADGGLHAVVVTERRATLHRLGATAEVVGEVRALRFALRRAAFAPGDGEFAYAANGLDDLLLAPLRRRVGDRGLVLIPPGVLRGVPWAALPSCRERPVTTAPSIATWLRAANLPPAPGDGPVTLVAGPGLPEALAEVTALVAHYPEATVLTGDDARAAAVLSALDGAACAHVAAHGVLRADSPQFSALVLADGPLTVYDLETLRRPPRLVVLSACDSGASVAAGGDDMMGLAAALLAAGTRTLIGSVTPVRDTLAKELMLDLHARLGKGAGPADALAAAQAATSDVIGASTFVCIGAG